MPQWSITSNRHLFPAAMTQGNLLAGFTAICGLAGLIPVEQWGGSAIPFAACCLIVGMLLDVGDGWVARKLNASSENGTHLDAAADLVTFGVAPALMVLSFAQDSELIVGLIVCGVYVACASLRLARFQTAAIRPDEQGSRLGDFSGLPTPAAAGLIAGSCWWAEMQPDVISRLVFHTLALLTFLAAMLMVSSLAYPHPLRSRRTPLVTSVTLATVVAAWFVGIPGLLSLFGAYAMVPLWSRSMVTAIK